MEPWLDTAPVDVHCWLEYSRIIKATRQNDRQTRQNVALGDDSRSAIRAEASMNRLPGVTGIVKCLERPGNSDRLSRKCNDCLERRASVSLTAPAMAQATEHRFACDGIANPPAKAAASQFSIGHSLFSAVLPPKGLSRYQHVYRNRLQSIRPRLICQKRVLGLTEAIAEFKAFATNTAPKELFFVQSPVGISIDNYRFEIDPISGRAALLSRQAKLRLYTATRPQEQPRRCAARR